MINEEPTYAAKNWKNTAKQIELEEWAGQWPWVVQTHICTSLQSFPPVAEITGPSWRMYGLKWVWTGPLQTPHYKAWSLKRPLRFRWGRGLPAERTDWTMSAWIVVVVVVWNCVLTVTLSLQNKIQGFSSTFSSTFFVIFKDFTQSKQFLLNIHKLCDQCSPILKLVYRWT